MKTLYLLRHSKSDKDQPNLADHDRPLNDKGLKDAAQVGKMMIEKGVKPDVILCSSAKRAADTAQLASKAAGYQGKIQTNRKLYKASQDTFLDIIQSTPQDIQALMLVGHNPELEDLVFNLTSKAVEIPTSGLIGFEFPIASWKDINYTQRRGKCRFYWME